MSVIVMWEFIVFLICIMARNIRDMIEDVRDGEPCETYDIVTVVSCTVLIAAFMIMIAAEVFK